jgi:hypothetical protein
VDRHSQFDAKNAMPELTCSEFDALLSDALDGVLSTASQLRFDLHKEKCATCAPLFRDSLAGMDWLNSLEEVEAPANLVHNILAATTMRTSPVTATVPKLTWKDRLVGTLADVVAPARALVRQPRMAMTTAMAIFSLTLSLNFAGFKLSDLRHLPMRPSAIKELATMRYYETSSRVVKYYENIRLVYEVESRLQELKRATTSEEEDNRPPAERKKTDNEKPDLERKQNFYSMQRQNMLLANWSATELKKGSNLLCFAASKDAAGNCSHIHIDDDFYTAELSRGLKPGKESSNVYRRAGLGNESTRSLLA